MQKATLPEDRMSIVELASASGFPETTLRNYARERGKYFLDAKLESSRLYSVNRAQAEEWLIAAKHYKFYIESGAERIWSFPFWKDGIGSMSRLLTFLSLGLGKLVVELEDGWAFGEIDVETIEEAKERRKQVREALHAELARTGNPTNIILVP